MYQGAAGSNKPCCFLMIFASAAISLQIKISAVVCFWSDARHSTATKANGRLSRRRYYTPKCRWDLPLSMPPALHVMGSKSVLFHVFCSGAKRDRIAKLSVFVYLQGEKMFLHRKILMDHDVWRGGFLWRHLQRKVLLIWWYKKTAFALLNVFFGFCSFFERFSGHATCLPPDETRLRSRNAQSNFVGCK